MVASNAPAAFFCIGRSVNAGAFPGRYRNTIAAAPRSLSGRRRHRQGLPGGRAANRLVDERLLRRHLVAGAAGQPRDRLVERRLDVRVRQTGAQTHLRLNLQRLAEVLHRLIALLEPAQGDDPQGHVGARADRVRHQPGPFGGLERLVQQPQRRVELQVLVGVDRLSVEDGDLADRCAVSVVSLGGARHQRRGGGRRPTSIVRLQATACRDVSRLAPVHHTAVGLRRDSPKTPADVQCRRRQITVIGDRAENRCSRHLGCSR